MKSNSPKATRRVTIEPKDFFPEYQFKCLAMSVYRCRPNAYLPEYATNGSACFDLRACLDVSSVVVEPGKRILIPTGLIFNIPDGHSVRLHPRSGLSLKNGIILANCEGVIDSDYVNEICAIILNVDAKESYTIHDGDKICQGEIVENIRCVFLETSVPPKVTTRTGGFGSTGK